VNRCVRRLSYEFRVIADLPLLSFFAEKCPFQPHRFPNAINSFPHCALLPSQSPDKWFSIEELFSWRILIPSTGYKHPRVCEWDMTLFTRLFSDMKFNPSLSPVIITSVPPKNLFLVPLYTKLLISPLFPMQRSISNPPSVFVSRFNQRVAPPRALYLPFRGKKQNRTAPAPACEYLNFERPRSFLPHLWMVHVLPLRLWSRFPLRSPIQLGFFPYFTQILTFCPSRLGMILAPRLFSVPFPEISCSSSVVRACTWCLSSFSLLCKVVLVGHNS